MAKTAAHLITSLEGGGTEHYLWQLITNSPPGWTHRVFFLKKDGVMGRRLRERGVPVERAGNPGTLFSRLKWLRPDVLHTCLFRAHQMGRLIGRLAGVPWIVSSQQAIDTWQRPWHRWMDALTLRFADAVIVNSQAAERLAASRLGSRKRPALALIENGLDPFPAALPSPSSARQALGLPAQALIGAALMRLHPEKGADRIPDFAERALSRRPDLHLIVGGVGPLEKGLRRAARDRPWSSRLHWMGWQENPYSFLAAADFFWSLSREESFPQALLEAAAAGLPWIAPEVGGVPELQKNGGVGLLFKAGDIQEAADRAAELLENWTAFSSRARQAAAPLRARYSVERMVQRTFKIFEQQGP